MIGGASTLMSSLYPPLKSVCFFGLYLFVGVSPLCATVYYVSPSGSDSNSGLSAALPWQTLTKVSGYTFAAGDQCLFQSGQTFSSSAGSALTIKGAGTLGNPIVFGIYGGTADAVISQTNANNNGVAFSTTNAYITLQDLEIAGPFAWSSTTTTVASDTPYGIYVHGPTSGTPLTGITLQRLLVHNFGGCGIRTPQVQSGSNYKSQLVSNLSISDTQVYQVGANGIRIGDDDEPQGGQAHTNIYVGHCYVYDTRLNGIQFQCGKTTTIEYCDIHDAPVNFIEPSGQSGGPYGVQEDDVADGLIQYCEIYNNTGNAASGVDDGGVDWDGGCQDCVVQYCYTHDNNGPGYGIAHWANAADAGSPIYASQTLRNTIRYNISVNDGKANTESGLTFWTANTAATLDNRAYNNLIIQTRSGGTSSGIEQLFGTETGTAADPTRIYNNIFISGNNHPLSSTVNSSWFIMDKNIWWSLNGTFTYKNGSSATTLAATDPAGIQADPLINGEPSSLLTAPTVGYANIDNMQQFLASQFEELVGSPATNAGLNLTLATYGSLSVGTQDFFGTSIPQNTAYDIGPYEMPQSPPALANDSFETPSVGTAASQYNPAGGTWTFASNSGIQSNGSTWAAPAAPNGTQTAFLEGKSGVNGTISQTINFPATGTFEVTFQSALRTSTSSQTFNVQIDGTTVGTFTPTSGSFTSFASNAFTVSTTGNHTLAFVGTGTGSDCTDFIDSVGIEPVTLSPASIPWTDSHIQYSGRFDNSRPDCTQFAYSASSITASFTGTSLTAFLSGPEQYFRIILDGQIQSTLLEIIPGTTSYSVVSGLLSGTHTVTLVKLNEPNLTATSSQQVFPTSGTFPVQFFGFQLDPGQSLVTPPSLPTNRIEVIGDSVACGYGNLAPSGTTTYSLTQEDGYYAFGDDAARLLGAEYHSVAWSGGYLYDVNTTNSTFTPVNLPGIYPTALPQTTTPWNYASWVPGVVVINLGTNDFGYFKGSGLAYPFTETQWVSQYTSFIGTIRANYPNAMIYCMVGPMLNSGNGLSDCETYVQEVVSTMNTSGDSKVRYFEVPNEGGNIGANGHPNKAEDATVAGLLAAQISTDLGWTVGTTAAIATGPAPSTVTTGQTASFSVVASGTGPFYYQWLNGGVAIPGATSSTYSIANAAAANDGTYSVIVSNVIGSVTSSGATLTVNAASAVPFSQWATNNGISNDPAATPAGDGVSNLLKYVTGASNPSQPISSSDRLGLPTVGVYPAQNPTELTLTYRQSSAMTTDTTIAVQSSSDMKTWTTLTFSTTTPTSTTYNLQSAGTDPATGDPIWKVLVPLTSLEFIRLNISTND